MTPPRRLVDWPLVQVEVECSLCPRHGRYRLARLAERYGAGVPLGRLLELIAADCTLMKPGDRPRPYEARCGVRYLVPPAGPLPAEAPARAGTPRPGAAPSDPQDPRDGASTRTARRRLRPDGPPPTLAMLRLRGITAVSVTCQGLWRGHPCHRTTSLPLDRLGAPDDAVFLDLCRTLRLVCSRCGGRTMHVVPLWPDVRRARAASLGADVPPAMPGVAPRRRPGTGEPQAG